MALQKLAEKARVPLGQAATDGPGAADRLDTNPPRKASNAVTG